MSGNSVPGALRDRKPELYAAFAAAESVAVIATRFEVHTSTIKYHLKQWELAGRPDPRAAATAEPAETDDSQPAEPELPAPAQTADAEVEPPTAPAPPADPENPPATEAEIQRLADVLQGKVAPPPGQAPLSAPVKRALIPSPQPKAPEPEWDIKPEQVYEGAIHRIEPSYMLVDIIELGNMKGCPRGKVLAGETGINKSDLRDGRLKEGDLVNVKALSVNWDPIRKKLAINLSISQAPPHPEMSPTEPEQEPEPIPALTQEPVSSALPAAEPATAAAQAAPAATTTPAPAVPAQPKSGSLCASCIHHFGPFCPFKDNYVDEVNLAAEHKPKELAGIEVIYGPRPVLKCSAYTSLDSIKAG